MCSEYTQFKEVQGSCVCLLKFCQLFSLWNNKPGEKRTNTNEQEMKTSVQELICDDLKPTSSRLAGPVKLCNLSLSG